MSERTKIAALLKSTDENIQVQAKGWVRTKRGNKHVSFIALNDGSCLQNIQVVADNATISEDILKEVQTGACLSVIGQLVPSEGVGQNVEIKAEEIMVLGKSHAEQYPLQPKSIHSNT